MYVYCLLFNKIALYCQSINLILFYLCFINKYFCVCVCITGFHLNVFDFFLCVCYYDLCQALSIITFLYCINNPDLWTSNIDTSVKILNWTQKKKTTNIRASIMNIWCQNNANIKRKRLLLNILKIIHRQMNNTHCFAV